MKGGGGPDTLKGGGGDDILIGGGGPDRFQFTANSGDDVIRRFTDGQDVIEIQGGASGFDELTIQETRDGAEISFANASILLDGRDASLIGEEDFLFT